MIIELTNGNTVNCGSVAAYTESLQYSPVVKNKQVVGYTVNGIGTVTDIELVIPSTYRGKPVKAIAESAFSACGNLTSVTILGGVTTIGKDAFSGCTGLTSVTISDSVTAIGIGAFAGCTGLTSVTLPDRLTLIERGLFFQCKELKKVYYTGTAEEWEQINISEDNTNLIEVTRYYYSEERPTEAGNYWHYVDGEVVEW